MKLFIYQMWVYEQSPMNVEQLTSHRYYWCCPLSRPSVDQGLPHQNDGDDNCLNKKQQVIEEMRIDNVALFHPM